MKQREVTAEEVTARIADWAPGEGRDELPAEVHELLAEWRAGLPEIDPTTPPGANCSIDNCGGPSAA